MATLDEDMLLWNLTHTPSAASNPGDGHGAEEHLEGELAEPLGSSLEELLAVAGTRNTEGLQFLQKGNFEGALVLLTQAQNMLVGIEEPDLDGTSLQALAAVRADTLSHLGVYHRRRGDLELAARCLQQGLREHRVAGSDRRLLGATHLNLAACHTELRASGTALQHAMAAVELGGQLVAASELEPGPDLIDEEPKVEDYAMLAVAYHKLAEAHEGLREWGRATFAYTQAYEVAWHSLGPKHHLTRSFERSSRCPQHARSHGGAPPSPVRQAAPSGRRLPEIQRPRSRAGPCGAPPPAQAYQITKEIFPPWPPRASSREERRWYAFAQSRPNSRASAGTGKGGTEPTLDELTSLRVRLRD